MTIDRFTTGRQAAGDDRLEELRSELDQIDERLRESLRARLEVCVRIAEYKRDHAVPMMQPHRIGIVQERAARYAATHGIDPVFIRRLYELIIEETCRVEDLVIEGEEV